MPSGSTPDIPGLFDEPVDLHRFLLVISPPKELEEEVIALKGMLRGKIGGFSGSRTIPHITLFYADLPEECERDVRAGVARGCIGQRAFALRMNGITHFPDKRTIYIDPIEKEAIAIVRKNIVAHVRAFKGIKKLGVNATDHPHLTIAAGLKPHQFEEAWALLAPHAYTSEQVVTDVLLLRRALRAETAYDVVQRFPLEPIRVQRTMVT